MAEPRISLIKTSARPEKFRHGMKPEFHAMVGWRHTRFSACRGGSARPEPRQARRSPEQGSPAAPEHGLGCAKPGSDLASKCTSQACTSDGGGRRWHQRQGCAGSRGKPRAHMRRPTHLENTRTLDPHSQAAVTDLSSWLGPTREIHEPALVTVVGGKSSARQRNVS